MSKEPTLRSADAAAKSVTGPTSRRKFMAGLALGAGLAPFTSLLRQRDVSATPGASAASDLCYNSNKLPLTPQDFSFRGYYDVATNGADSTYMRSLSHRYVNNQLRFLTLTHTGLLHEFSLPGGFGSSVGSPTGVWNISSVCGDFTGIWWEEAKQRLWVTASVDYGDSATYYPTRISTLTLGANGAVSNAKTVSLEGITSKRAYGGVQAVPVWAQTALGCGPYVAGFGGYTSLVAATSRGVIGPSLIGMPDITNYSNGAVIPAGALKVMLDTPTNARGVRRTLPVNYFDGLPEWLTYPPTAPPDPRSSWLSPNPEGLGWFVWGDSYYNTGMWIDGPTKQGFAAIASLGKGKCWYQNSTLNFDDRQFELHLWDSFSLNQGIGTRPTSMTELIVPKGTTPLPWQGDVPTGNLSGATFDPITSKLFAVGYPLGANINAGRLYEFTVTA